MSQDTFVPSGEQAPSGGIAAPGRAPIDRFEMKQQFLERSEEAQVEAAADLYEKAARQWMQGDAAPDESQPLDEEELAALSQELKLKQMCQDIAALKMVDELEDSSDDEE